MPKFDLAGNELPDEDPIPQSALPPRGSPPQSPGQPPGAPQSGNWHPAPAYAPPGGSRQPPPYTPPQSPYGQPGNWTPPPPGNAPPGVWPPPATGTRGYGTPAPNTSGEHGDVPPEIAQLKWNWGAFAWPWLWCLNHRLWAFAGIITALVIVSSVHGFVHHIASFSILGVHIYLGINGHKLAWQNRRFSLGYSEFIEVQTIWKNWAIGVMVVWAISVIALFAIVGMKILGM